MRVPQHPQVEGPNAEVLRDHANAINRNAGAPERVATASDLPDPTSNLVVGRFYFVADGTGGTGGNKYLLFSTGAATWVELG